MLNSYLSGDALLITLPGDVAPKTVFHILPMTQRITARWRAMKDFARRKAADARLEETPDTVLSDADAELSQQLAYLAARIPKIENAGEPGRTISTVKEIEVYLDGLLFQQYSDLLEALMDEGKLKELLFRPEPSPGDAASPPIDDDGGEG